MRKTGVLLMLVAVLTACSTKQLVPVAMPAGVEDLVGHTVVVAGGSSTDLLLSQYEGIDLMRIGVGDMPMAVKSGRAEYAMIQEVQYDANHMDREGFRKCFGGILKGLNAVAFRQDDTETCGEFNSFLAEMHASGEYERWHGGWIDNLDSMAVATSRIPVPRDGKKITVGITIVFPYIYQAGETLTGMEIDLFNRFCRSKGYTPEYSIIQFQALIPSLNAGKIDAVVTHLMITPERAKQVLFSDAYMEAGQCCFGMDPGWVEVEGPGFRERVKDSFHRNLIEEDRWKLLAGGLLVTLEISFFSLLLAIVVGALLCFLRMRRNVVVSDITRLFVNLIRGIPVLVILMIMFYVVFASLRLSGVTATVLSFGLFFGAIFSEVFRSGMMSVSKGQWEAGAALGMNKVQVFRFVALPQALRRIVPVFKGEVIAMIKCTAIVGYVAVLDLTFAGEIIRTRTLDPFFPLILVSLIYILLSRLSGALMDALDRKLNSTK